MQALLAQTCNVSTWEFEVGILPHMCLGPAWVTDAFQIILAQNESLHHRCKGLKMPFVVLKPEECITLKLSLPTHMQPWLAESLGFSSFEWCASKVTQATTLKMNHMTLSCCLTESLEVLMLWSCFAANSVFYVDNHFVMNCICFGSRCSIDIESHM